MIYSPYNVSWIDKEFMESIADEIISLKDYVPKAIEKGLPDYEKRKRWVNNHKRIINDDFREKQIIDQCAAGTTWEEHVMIYDEFFEKYPQYKDIIKDEEKYKKWKEFDPFI